MLPHFFGRLCAPFYRQNLASSALPPPSFELSNLLPFISWPSRSLPFTDPALFPPQAIFLLSPFQLSLLVHPPFVFSSDPQASLSGLRVHFPTP